MTGPAYAFVMALGLTMAALLEIARLVLSVLACSPAANAAAVVVCACLVAMIVAVTERKP